MQCRGVWLSCSISLLSSVAIGCGKDTASASAAAPSATTGVVGASQSPSGRQEPPQCSIVSLAELESTLGVDGLKGPETRGEWPVRACEFSGGSLNLPLVTLRFEVISRDEDFQTIRKNHEGADQPTKDFPGLGEAAFSAYVGKFASVAALYKKTVVYVTTPRAPLEKQVALVRMVLGRM